MIGNGGLITDLFCPFQYYHEQVCANCHMVPLESSICLFCGAIVCLKQHCCKTSEGCEAVRVSNSRETHFLIGKFN